MPKDLSLDASFSSDMFSEHSSHGGGQLVIKNTFIEFQAEKAPSLRRSFSGSDISSLSAAQSTTGSGRNTPSLVESELNSNNSWADQFDDGDDQEGEGGQVAFQGEWPVVAPTVEALELYEKLSVLAHGRALPAKVLAKLTEEDTATPHIPRDPDGNLLSLGSIPHGVEPVASECKPCIFFFKERCSKGQYCLHCHIPHPAFKAKRLRASKATRQRRAKMWTGGQEEEKVEAKGSACGSSAHSVSSQNSGSVRSAASQKKGKAKTAKDSTTIISL